ncbi:hypothetical protein Tco_1140466 [Tanacetum coccineum]
MNSGLSSKKREKKDESIKGEIKEEDGIRKKRIKKAWYRGKDESLKKREVHFLKMKKDDDICAIYNLCDGTVPKMRHLKDLTKLLWGDLISFQSKVEMMILECTAKLEIEIGQEAFAELEPEDFDGNEEDL